jgi:hypothetical protein
MAIFVPGMLCSISGRAIWSASDAVLFPPFVSNEADPLHIFSDAVVHVDAFRKHPLASQVKARCEELQRRTRSGARKCFICGQEIADPDEYLGLGYLVADESHPLHRFNYAQFHRSCFAQWPERPELIDKLRAFDESGTWRGNGLKWLIDELGKATAQGSLISRRR